MPPRSKSTDPIAALVLGAEGFIVSRALRRNRVAHLDHSGLADLIAAGREGALEAARRFDPSRGILFATYVCRWVDEWIRREAALLTTSVRVPADKGDTGMATRSLRTRARKAAHGIDEPIYSHGKRTLADVLPIDEMAADEALARESMAVELRRSRRSARAIGTSSSSTSARGVQLRAIGAQLGVSHQRVDQISQRALIELRWKLRRLA